MDQGLIFARPKISKLKEENVRSGFFEREEFNGVLQHLPEKLQLIARVAYVTGWRHGEVVQLRRKNLDLKRGLLRLNPGTTKNDEGRAFPLHAELRQVFERALEIAKVRTYRTKVVRLKDDPEALIFTKKNGTAILRFDKAWWTACRATGIPDRVEKRTLPNGKEVTKVTCGRIFHDFRRTAVRNLENAGAPVARPCGWWAIRPRPFTTDTLSVTRTTCGRP